MLRRYLLILSILIGVLAPLAQPSNALASFHLMKVVEVFPGTEAAPDAQYVVLQMFSGGQSFVAGHSVIVYDASGVEINRFTFAAGVTNGANQDRILIATTVAATFFGVSADLTMTPVLQRAGGRVCFDTIDCVSWGSHPVVVSAGAPFSPTVGLIGGVAMGRRLDVAGVATSLEDADDTNQSANDFVLRAPSPRNNARVVGTIPTSTCGNSAVEGLESCDDGNTADDAVCPGSCVLRCGDGVVASPIECEPASTPTCTGACRPIIALDAGTPDASTPDGGEADAGTALDAGADAGSDAGVVDAGTDVDAGDEVDAGTDVDAGEEVDAGNDVDAGEEVDAGNDVDSGTPRDGGTIDGGTRDGGTRDGGTRDGAVSADAGMAAPEETDGCGCHAAGAGRGSGGAALVLAAGAIALLVRRRRR